MRFLGASMLLCLAAIGMRGVQLCVAPSDRTIREASAQRWGQVTLQARRGEVLDRNGRRLATSVDTPNVIVDPQMVEPGEELALARQVAAAIGRPVDGVLQQIRREGSRYAVIERRVHPRIAVEVSRIGHPALWIERASRRYYPEETLAAHMLGFVDANGHGRSGLEIGLDEHLAGGTILVQRRRDRRGLAVDDPLGDDERDRSAGMTVHTTIDRRIQRITERALEGVMLRSDPLSVSAVVVDVRSGDILALANAPTFNPNAPGVDPVPRRNHAVQDAIEPGSVFKPFTAAAAVEEGLVTESTPIDCEGGTWYLGRSRIRDDHPHGRVTVSEVVKYSSNIGAAKLALQVGSTDFIDYMRAFGFGERSGIELPGERRGTLRSADKIRPIELATTSYGQGVTSTVLQLAMATATIANGGVRMRPRLVTRVEDAHGIPELVQPAKAVRRVISEDTAQQVTRMMVTVTEPGGTATRAQIPGFRVAGKTGTAEKAENGRYGAGRIGSFIGFVPADDPVIAIVVSVDEPRKGSRYGGIVAAPAFAEIGQAVLHHLGVEPDPALLDAPASAPSPTPEPASGGFEPLNLRWAGGGWELPDLQGRGLRDVVAGLGPSGVRLDIRGTGHVVRQEPEAGAIIAPGQSLRIRLQ
ncbi:MAG: cell division protein FtsI (penicillin-binding protein 3) [Myxococcota bacterium]|jgi:cell division protein FtsI (penicillin-binding protein 3)